MISRYFKLTELGTSVKQEFIAGAATFITMAYVVIVNPKILESAGMPFGAAMTATILSAFFGTLLMGVYAKRPFAIAPYLGENAFITYTIIKVLGYSWQTALGAIFITGVILTILTLVKARSWFVTAIPESLKIAFTVGLGLFLAFIGLNETSIVVLGVEGVPVQVGDFTNPGTLLAILGLLLISFLMIRKVKGAVLFGIALVTFLGFLLNISPLPERWVSLPPSMEETFLQMDLSAVLSWGFFSAILTIVIIAFVDTMGALIGVSYKAGFLDAKGNLPDIQKPMLCDALTTIAASLFGATTCGVVIESASGIEAGGKSGLTAVVTAFLFLFALFFAPFLGSVPSYSYGSALIVVGLLMLAPIAKLDFKNIAETLPAVVTILLMSFTLNIGIGITAGFILYPLTNLAAGNIGKVNLGMWLLFLISLTFYIFYPY